MHESKASLAQPLSVDFTARAHKVVQPNQFYAGHPFAEHAGHNTANKAAHACDQNPHQQVSI
jgi:hypothetical protein